MIKGLVHSNKEPEAVPELAIVDTMETLGRVGVSSLSADRKPVD